MRAQFTLMVDDYDTLASTMDDPHTKDEYPLVAESFEAAVMEARADFEKMHKHDVRTWTGGSDIYPRNPRLVYYFDGGWK